MVANAATKVPPSTVNTVHVNPPSDVVFKAFQTYFTLVLFRIFLMRWALVPPETAPRWISLVTLVAAVPRFLVNSFYVSVQNSLCSESFLADAASLISLALVNMSDVTELVASVAKLPATNLTSEIFSAFVNCFDVFLEASLELKAAIARCALDVFFLLVRC